MNENQNSQCARVGMLFRGCKWRARYDISEPVITGSLPVLMSGDVKNLCRTQRYVRDVCETCGAIKER